MLNRKIQPEIKNIDQIHFIVPEKKLLNNKVPVYEIDAGAQDVTVIRFVFKAGDWYQQHPLIASTANRMLREGSKQYSSFAIADKLDFYGAELETYCSSDFAEIALFTLNKYIENLLPVLEDIIKHPVFPEQELSVFLQNQKQNLIIKREKVNFVAKEYFDKLIFGNSHPYNNIQDIKDFETLDRNELLNFQKAHYSSENCSIIVAGKTDQTIMSLLNKFFGDNDWSSESPINSNSFTIKTESQKIHFIEKKDAVQSAIRIGKPLFNRTHPDYVGFRLLNTVLGGYFGSRLMSNIREDKGFTYGIGSNVMSLLHAGYFYISTEVGIKDCKQTLDEIYFEIERLKNEPVPENELELVKNYLLGNLMRNMDGPFAQADLFKTIMKYGLANSYYEKYVDKLKSIRSEELSELAIKYLDTTTMLELVVGKK